MPSDQKTAALEALNNKIRTCKICQKQAVGVLVPGEGNAHAEIVFVGEAPGKEESKTGRPFIGRAGKLLRSLMADAGISDADVFITSAVKYLPEYITPTPADIAHGRTHLLPQLAIIKPKYVVLLGNTAARALVTKPVSLTKDHGIAFSEGRYTFFLAFHPAAPLHNPPVRPLIIDDFKKLKRLINKKECKKRTKKTIKKINPFKKLKLSRAPNPKRK